MNYKYFSIIIFAGISAFLLLSPIIVNAVDCTSVPAGGSYIVTSSCSFNTPTMTGDDIGGVDNGGITINNGVNLLVTSNQKIVWGPGKSIVINGSITIDNGGSLTQTNIWMYDNDTDGYPVSLTTQVFAQDSTPGAGYRRRNALTSHTASDVNDGNASVWQNLDCYTDADGDGYDFNGSTSSTESGTDCPSGMSLTSSGTDCLDSDADVYQNITNLADDTDQDRWYTGSLATRCVGAKTSFWYSDSAGTDKWISSSDDLGTSDCSTGDATRWKNRYDTDTSDCKSLSTCVGNHAGYADAKAKYTVFLYDVALNGDLNTQNGADDLCNSAASAEGLSGSYTAWIGPYPSEEPRDRGLSTCFSAGSSSVGWYLVTNEKVADNWADLTDGTIDTAIDRTQQNFNKGTQEVWSNLSQSGSNLSQVTNCFGYNRGDSGAWGLTGLTPSTNNDWTDYSNDRCDAVNFFYCFQDGP